MSMINRSDRMGFLDRFRKGEPDETEEREIIEKNIPLENIYEDVDKMLSENVKSSVGRAEKSRDEIFDGYNIIKDAAKKMESTYFEKKDKTYTRINMIKDTWLKKLLLNVDKPPKMDKINLEALKGFISDVNVFIGSVTMTDPRQNYILSNYFKKDMKRIVSALSDMRKNVETLEGLIRDGEPIRISGDMEKLVNDMISAKSEKKEKEIKIAKIGKQIEEMEALTKEREKNIEDMKNGVEMSRLISLERSIKDLEKEASEIKIRLSEELSIMNRPLKKIKYSSDDSESRIIGEYLSSPVDSCLASGGEGKVENIIRIVSKYADDKDIGISEKDAKKIATFAEKIKNGDIKKTKERLKDILKTLDDMRREIKGLEKVRKRKASVENDLETIKAETERIKRDFKRNDNELLEISKRIDKIKKELLDYSEDNLFVRYLIS